MPAESALCVFGRFSVSVAQSPHGDRSSRRSASGSCSEGEGEEEGDDEEEDDEEEEEEEKKEDDEDEQKEAAEEGRQVRRAARSILIFCFVFFLVLFFSGGGSGVKVIVLKSQVESVSVACFGWYPYILCCTRFTVYFE